MGKVRAPLFSVSAAGDIQGSLIRRWRNLHTVAEFVPQTESVFGPWPEVMSDAINLYQGLTLDEQEEWEKYSKKFIGESGDFKVKTLPGYQQFLKHYAMAYICGVEGPEIPPNTDPPGMLEDVSVATLGAEGNEIKWPKLQDGDICDIRGDGYIKPSRRFYLSKLKALAAVPLENSGYVHVGDDFSGWKAVYKLRILRFNGQSGPWYVTKPFIHP